MKKNYLQTAEKVFAIVGLTFFTGAFGAGAGDNTTPLLPSVIVSLIRYTVWFVSFAVVVLNYKKSLRTASQDIFIWILTPIVCASSIWSLNPSHTQRFMVEILQMTSFALYFATRFNLKQQVRIVAWTFGIGAIVSIFVVWRFPAVGLHWHDHPGSWKGIYDYKNTLGSMMIIGSIAFLLMPVESLKHWRYKWGFFLLMLLMIYFSTSKTSLIVSFLVLVILYFYRKFRWQGKLSIFYLDLGVLTIGGIGGLVIALWIEILGLFGKDVTLTGRLPMWVSLINRLLTEQPLLGFGRGAFWADNSRYAIEAGLAITERYIPPHAHNGYIDLALDVGLIGLSLFLISLIITYIRSLKLAYKAQSTEYIWPLGFLLFLSLNNMSESYLLRLANVYWVLYLATAFSVGKEIRSLDLKRRLNQNH